MNLKALRERRAAVQAKIDAIIALADKDQGGILTEEQSGQIETLEAEWTSVNRSIAAVEKNESRRAFLSAPAPARAVVDNAVIASTIEVVGQQEGPRGGFRSLAHFAADVRAVVTNTRPSEAWAPYMERINAAATSPHNEGVGIDGGFEVPAEYRQQLWRLAFTEDDVLSLFTPQPTASNQVNLLADESTPWGTKGLKAYWRGESDSMTRTKTYREPRPCRLNELYVFTEATNELLEDAPMLVNRLTVDAAAAIRYKLLEGIIDGNGVGKPLGYLQAASLVSVAKESGQAADSIVALNVAKMIARAIVGGKDFWLINQDCLPQIMVMTIGNQPIWTPANAGFKEAPGGYLLGRPVKFSQHCDTVGDQGDIQYVNPEGYFLVNKQNGVTFDSSIHLYFDTNETAFRWIFRAGGMPYLKSAVTPKNSSNTLSHFVVLDARA